MKRMHIEVKRNDNGAWCLYLNGELVSDHRTHKAARLAARDHYVAALRILEARS